MVCLTASPHVNSKRRALESSSFPGWGGWNHGLYAPTCQKWMPFDKRKKKRKKKNVSDSLDLTTTSKWFQAGPSFRHLVGELCLTMLRVVNSIGMDGPLKRPVTVIMGPMLHDGASLPQATHCNGVPYLQYLPLRVMGDDSALKLTSKSSLVRPPGGRAWLMTHLGSGCWAWPLHSLQVVLYMWQPLLWFSIDTIHSLWTWCETCWKTTGHQFMEQGTPVQGPITPPVMIHSIIVFSPVSSAGVPVPPAGAPVPPAGAPVLPHWVPALLLHVYIMQYKYYIEHSI